MEIEGPGIGLLQQIQTKNIIKLRNLWIEGDCFYHSFLSLTSKTAEIVDVTYGAIALKKGTQVQREIGRVQ
jgi:hypothetical protein